jgi:hypothetical protein
MKTVIKWTIALGVVLTIPTSALAQVTTTTSNCRPGYLGGVTCSATSATIEPERPRSYSAKELADIRRETDERHRKWTAFCQPEVYQDENYLKRYRYAHKGCDIGRDEY